MNYFPFHIGDYAAHTAHLSWEEDIAYRRMLDVYYLHEKALPADISKIARLIRMPKSAKAIAAVLDEFFLQASDGWHNERADAELISMHTKQENQSAKDAHEAERLRRHRSRRAEIFETLRERGIVPAFDASMAELQRMLNGSCNAPETRTGPLPETDQSRRSLPTPTPTPTPTPKEKTKAAPPSALPEWIPGDAWAGFVAMRVKVRKPMTERARELLLSKLDAMRGGGHDIAAVLDQSTVNGWQDIFPLKAPSDRAAPIRAPKPENFASTNYGTGGAL